MTVEVPAPTSGVLSAIMVKEGDTVAVGSVLGAIGEGDGRAKPAPAPVKTETVAPQPAPQPSPAPAPVKPAEPLKMQPAALEREPTPREEVSDSGNGNGKDNGGMPPSPAARKYLAETGLPVASVVGSVCCGQVLKQDVLSAPATAPAATSGPVASAAASPLARAPAPEAPPAPRPPITPQDVTREERVRMTRLRQTIAKRLKEAQQTAAILTTFNECDMTAVQELRARVQEDFQKQHGVKLGFMSFFIKAAVSALKAVPSDQRPHRRRRLHPKPLLRHRRRRWHRARPHRAGHPRCRCEKLRADRARPRRFRRRAREGRIKIEDLQGGVFTISNGGIYGSLLSTPILNPPQSGILGMHKIEDRARRARRPGRHPPDDVSRAVLRPSRRRWKRGGDLPGPGKGRHRGPGAAGAGFVAGVFCCDRRAARKCDR